MSFNVFVSGSSKCSILLHAIFMLGTKSKIENRSNILKKKKCDLELLEY